MARTKHVVPNEQVAHIWAHRAQTDARNPQGNFYFDGNTIYSYGGHFPIARHVARNGRKRCILFTTKTRSVTTAKHIRDTRMAIPPGVAVFHVPEVGTKGEVDSECIADYRRRFDELLYKAGKSIKYSGQYLIDAENIKKEAVAYARFFSMAPPKWKVPAFPTIKERIAKQRQVAAKVKKVKGSPTSGGEGHTANASGLLGGGTGLSIG